MTRLLLLPGP